MTRIVIIRHGESKANEKNLFAGFSDFTLTEKGHKQAEITAKYVAKNYKIDKIYASDLKRAYFTAFPLARLTENIIIPDEGLREIYAGEWEGACFFDLPNTHPEAFEVWANDIGNARCPDGESVRELAARILAHVKELAEENDGLTIALATHATPVRSIQTFCEYGDIGEMQKTTWVPNASVTELTYENGEFTLVKVGYVEHLKELVTVLSKDI